MSWRTFSLVAFVALIGEPFTVLAAEDEPPADVADEANVRVRALFREAYAAYNAKKYDESRELLLQAWSIRQTYDVASALAQSEMKLEHYREAVAHLQYCLDNVVPSTSEKTLEAIKHTFEEAKRHVGTLNIVTGDGVTITLDGVDIGQAPLNAPVFVDPGPHELVFKRGDDTTKRTIQIDAGAEQDLEVRVEHVEAPPPPKLVVPPPQVRRMILKPKPRDTRLDGIWVPAAVDGSIFVAGLAMALGFRLAADSNDAHAEDLRNQIGANGCAAGVPTNPLCAELLDTAKSKDQQRTWSAVGLAVSGLALAAVPVYWYWPRAGGGHSGAETSLRVGGTFRPGYSALSVGTAF